MHNAPSVSYPVGRSRWAGALALASAGAGLATVGSWAWVAPATGWRQVLAAATWLVAAGWALAAWRRSPAGELGWNGRAWVWSSDDRSGEVALALVLDLQRVLLVRVHVVGAAASTGRWLWLEQGTRPATWRALRRAVYSRARSEALPEAGSPPANT